MLKNKFKTDFFITLVTVLIFAIAKLSASPATELHTDDDSSSDLPAPVARLYQQHCAECHDGGVPKAPHSVTFQLIGPEVILNAMQDGVMQQQASSMSKDEQRTDQHAIEETL